MDHNYEEIDKLGKSILGKTIDHPRYGKGRVIEYSGSPSSIITVQFDDKTRQLSFDERTREMLNLISESEKKRKQNTITKNGITYLSNWEDDDMAESLLAHLYTRIKGSQEDVATMALQYIISSSDKLNETYNKLLSDALKINLAPDIRYSCQSVGENSERPDMSGVDRDGNEVILCEMKFYAGLTSNQPIGYIDRLTKENGKALVFVCPKQRKDTLWSKLIELCQKNKKDVVDVDKFCVSINGISMTIVTWNQIIEALRLTAASVDVKALPDITQLAGFCNMMDKDAFIPFSPEEIGPDTARRANRYYQIVDAVVDKLDTMKELKPCKKGKQNAYRSGYWRNITIKNHRIEFIYQRDLWIEASAEAPFWLSILDSDGKQPDSYRKFFDSKSEKEKHHNWDGRYWLPVFPLPFVPLDEIVEDIILQITSSIDELDRSIA